MCAVLEASVQIGPVQNGMSAEEISKDEAWRPSCTRKAEGFETFSLEKRRLRGEGIIVFFKYLKDCHLVEGRELFMLAAEARTCKNLSWKDTG